MNWLYLTVLSKIPIIFTFKKVRCSDLAEYNTTVSLWCCIEGYINYACTAVPCSCIISMPENDACSLLYLYAVMVMGRQVWLSLIPQLCLAPLTWDHLVSLCPSPDSCSAAFSSTTSLLCPERLTNWLPFFTFMIDGQQMCWSIYFCHCSIRKFVLRSM